MDTNTLEQNQDRTRVASRRRGSPLRSALVVLGVLAVLVWYLLAPQGAARPLVGNVLLLLIPLWAAVLWLQASRRAPNTLRAAWLFFAIAAFGVALGQLLFVAEPLLPRVLSLWELPVLLYLLFHIFFDLGVVAALGTLGDPEAAREIALDAALILTVAVLLMLRYVWAPGQLLGLRSPPQLLTFLIQVASLTSVFFAGLLALWRVTSVPAESVAAMMGTVGLFAIGNILTTKGFDLDVNSSGGFLDLLWIAGWLLFVYAAARGRRMGRVVAPRPRLTTLTDRLPRVLVPASVLFMAFFAIDGLGRPLDVGTGILLGTLGVLLAIRSYDALGTVKRRRQERRRLEHTQALIEVSRHLAAMTDLSQTLEVVTDWTRRLLLAPSAGIELINDDGSRLDMRAVSNLPPEALDLSVSVADSFTGWVVRHATARATADALADPLTEEPAASFLGHSPLAVAPLRYRGRVLGVLFACLRPDPFQTHDIELLQALADQAAIAIENTRLFEEVRKLSLTDPLTGLANRRQLARDLAREFAAAGRGRNIALIMFDLDNFKRFNDTHGHLAGDDVLRIFGRVLDHDNRAMNLVARYGGDEFIALLADCERSGAEIFVQRVAKHFGDALAERYISGVGVSAGVAIYDDTMDRPDDLIMAADQALYRSKAGRASAS